MNIKAEIRKIHETQDIIIKADKSRNLYSVPIQQYNELLLGEMLFLNINPNHIIWGWLAF